MTYETILLERARERHLAAHDQPAEGAERAVAAGALRIRHRGRARERRRGRARAARDRRRRQGVRRRRRHRGDELDDRGRGPRVRAQGPCNAALARTVAVSGDRARQRLRARRRLRAGARLRLDRRLGPGGIRPARSESGHRAGIRRNAAPRACRGPPDGAGDHLLRPSGQGRRGAADRPRQPRGRRTTSCSRKASSSRAWWRRRGRSRSR